MVIELKREDKWHDKFEISYKQYFKAPWSMPSEAAVQIARLMEKTIGTEKSKTLLTQLFNENAIKMTEEDNQNPINSFEDFTKLLESMLNTEVNQHAMDYTLVYEGRGRVRALVSKCLWVESFTEMDAADLGIVMRCGWEPVYFEGFSPNLKVTHNKLLMKGDDCCDICFEWKE